MGRLLGLAAGVLGLVTVAFEVTARGRIDWLLFGPAVLLQAYLLLRLGLLVAVSRPARGDRRPRLNEAQAAKVVAATEVAVIVSGESAPTIRTALVAAVDAVPAGRVLLVSADPRHEEIAARLGVRWCPAQPGWHAGMEAALASASSTFLAITSASTAVVPRTLSALARYIDRRCAWVQTLAVAPEHRRPLEHLDQLLVGPSVDARRAAAWTGAGSLVVVAAVRSVGLQDGTLGATVALQSRGWHGRGVRGTLALAQGDPAVAVAAEQSVDSVSRRVRILGTRRSPLWARGLSVAQRLVHLRTLVDDLAGAAFGSAVVVTVAALLVGVVPVPVNTTVLLGLLSTGVVAAVARWMLSSGLLRPGTLAQSAADDLVVSIGAVVRALGIGRHRQMAAVELDNVAGRDQRAAMRTRRGAMAAVVALEVALVVRALLSVVGGAGQGKGVDLALLAVGVALLVPLLASVKLIVRARHLRSSRRAPAPMRALLGQHEAQVIDLGADGVGLVAAAPIDLLSTVAMRLMPGDRAPIDLRGQVVRVRPVAGGTLVGVRLIGGIGRQAMDEYVRLWIDRVSRTGIEWPHVQRVTDERVAVRPPGFTFARVATVFTLLTVGVANLPPYATGVAAPPSGTLTVSVASSSRVLYGSDLTISVSACNRSADALFNTAVREVLPAGITYVAGSAVPAPTRVLSNQPSAGATTLLWQPVADLPIGGCTSLSFRVQHGAVPTDNGPWRVGNVIADSVGVFASVDPAVGPQFGGTGVPSTPLAPALQTATGAMSSTIVPITIGKDVTGGTNTGLRGVHEQPLSYRLRVTNNSVRATDTVTVDDYLPAELEFLGCGTVDSASPGYVEYEGAPRLDVSTPDLTSDCLEPSLVQHEMVDPDGGGPLSSGVYTHLRWTLGNLAPSATRTIRYAAGVPSRANDLLPPTPTTTSAPTTTTVEPTTTTVAPTTVVPTTVAPTTTTLFVATANLENNTGPSTGGAPRTLVSVASVSGTYTGWSATGSGARQWGSSTASFDSNDVAVAFSACNTTPAAVGSTVGTGCPNGVVEGGVTTWVMQMSASEYRRLDNATVLATVGDGLAYRDGSAAFVLDGTTVAPFEPSVVTNDDGTQSLTWDVASLLDTPIRDALAQPDVVFSIQFDTTTLGSYRASGRPVLVFDRPMVSTTLTATATSVRSDVGEAPVAISASSSASIGSSWANDLAGSGVGALQVTPLLGAAAAAVAGAEPCAPGASGVVGDTAPRFRPGDLACFEVAITFPSGVRARDAALTFALPGNAAYQWYSTFSDHTAGSELLAGSPPALGGTITFQVGADPSASPRFTVSGQVFHVVLAARIQTNPALNTAQLFTYTGRATATGTDGTTTTQRRDVQVRTVVPSLTVAIGLVNVVRNGASLAGYPSVLLQGSSGLGRDDLITVRTDIANAAVQQADPMNPSYALVEADGGQGGDARDVRVRVNLPGDIDCSRFTPADLASNLTTALSLRGGALPLQVVPTPSLTDVSCSGAVLQLTASVVPAGYDLRVSFTTKVSTDAGADSWYLVEAGVRQFSDRATTVYVPSSNIDPSLVASGNWVKTRTARWLATAAGSLSRSMTTSVTETGNSSAQATVGETVTYTVTLSLPAKSAVYQSMVSSSLPGGLDYLEGTVGVISSPLSPPSFGPSDEPAGWDLTETANGWALTLPTDTSGWRNDSTSAVTLQVQYQAAVKNVAGNTTGTVLNETATWSWNTRTGGPAASPRTATSTPVTVVEPSLSIARSISGSGVVAGGSAVSVSLQVTNASGASSAKELSLAECIPAGLGVPVPVTPTGWSAVVGPAGSCVGAGHLITFTTGALAPAAQAVLGYSAGAAVPSVAGQSLPMSGTLSARSMPSTTPPPRSYVLTTTGSVGVSVDPPQLTGASAVGQAARSQVVDHTYTVVVPAATRVFDATVVVTAASGLAIAGYGTVAPEYGPGCSVPGTVGHTIPPVAQQAGWFLGDVVAGAQPCVVTLTVRTTVRNSATLGSSLATTAAFAWGQIDRDNDRTTLSVAGLDATLTAGTTVTVVSPAVTIGRSVDDIDRLVEGGQSVVHTITVANAGNSAAFDIQVTDVLPTGLAATDTFGGTCAGASTPVVTASLTWTLFSDATGLQPGATCTITYRAQLAAATALTDGQTLGSTATVDRYFGVAGQTALPPDQQLAYTGQSAAVTLTAVRPTLKIDLTAADGSERVATRLGAPTGWTATVTNVSTQGPRVARGVDVVATLPPNWTFAALTSVTPARCTGMPVLATVEQVQTISWTNLCDLAVGEVLRIGFETTPQLGAMNAPGLVDGAGNRIVHETTATLSAEDAGGTTLGAATNTAGATLESVDLQVVTTDASAPDDGTPGSPGLVLGVAGAYYVDVNNNGPDPVAGTVTMTDTPPVGFLVTGASGAGWTCSVGATVVCTNPGPVAVGATLPRITISGVPTEASLNDVDGDGDPHTGLVVNRASVSSGQADRRITNDSDEEPTPVRRLSDLAISAAWSPMTPLVAGAQAVGTITVVTNGPSVAVGPVSVIDEVPTGLRLVRVRGTGWNCAASRVGTGYSAEANQNGRIACSRSLNGVAASTVLDPLEVTVQIDPARMSATTLSAVVSHANDPEPGNNAVTVSGATTLTSGLTVRVDDGDARFTAGQRGATMMVVTTNQGPSVEPGPVVVTTDLPVGLVPDEVAADGWSCATTARVVDGVDAARVTCTWIGADAGPDAVGVGQVLPMISMMLTVRSDAVITIDPEAASLVRTEATISGAATPEPQTDGVDTVVAPVADLSVVSGPTDTDPWQVGDTGGYALVITNNGPSPEYGPVVVSKPIPEGATFVSGRGDGWSCQVDRGAAEIADVVTCTHGRPAGMGPDQALLAVDESLSPLVIDVAVGPGVLPGPSASPVVVGGSAAVKGVTDAVWASASDQVSVVGVADLSVERSGEANTLRVGEQATYTVRVTNAGPNASAAGVVVTDVLPTGVELVDWAGEGFTCLPSADGPSCTFAEPIAVGDTRAVTLTVVARPEAYTGVEGIDGAVSASGPNIDRNPGDNELEYSLAIEPLIDLAVTRHQSERFVVGRSTSFQLAVENLGPNVVSSEITLHNELPAGLAYTEVRASDWDCTTTDQHLACTLTDEFGAGEALPVVDVGVQVVATTADGVDNVATVTAAERDADTTNNEVRTALVVRMPESVVAEPALVPPTVDTTAPVDTVPVDTVPVDTTAPQTTVPVTSAATPDVVLAMGDAAERAPNLAIGMYLESEVSLGSQATWHLTVTNTGAGDAYDVLVSNSLPIDLLPLDATVASGLCAVTGQLVRCSFDSLHPDESRMIEVSTRVVGRGVDAVIRNTASVSGIRPELRADDNTVVVSTRLGAAVRAQDAPAAVDRGVDLPGGWTRVWVTVLGILGALAAVWSTYRVLVRPRRIARPRATKQ